MIIIKAMGIYRKDNNEKRTSMQKLEKQIGFTTDKQLERYRKIVERDQSRINGYEVEVLFEIHEV